MISVTTIAAVHAVATLALTGLIWFVQIVHYPLFARVPEIGFRRYEQEHQRRTTWVVGPLMLTEAATAVALAALGPDVVPAVVGLVLLAVIWLSTAFVQVPYHRALARSFDAETVRRLTRTNWIRTVAWSGRTLVALVLL